MLQITFIYCHISRYTIVCFVLYTLDTDWKIYFLYSRGRENIVSHIIEVIYNKDYTGRYLEQLCQNWTTSMLLTKQQEDG